LYYGQIFDFTTTAANENISDMSRFPHRRLGRVIEQRMSLRTRSEELLSALIERLAPQFQPFSRSPHACWQQQGSVRYVKILLF